MSFNHGWLVQAEAPPHALFARFKRAVDGGRTPDLPQTSPHLAHISAGAS